MLSGFGGECGDGGQWESALRRVLGLLSYAHCRPLLGRSAHLLPFCLTPAAPASDKLLKLPKGSPPTNKSAEPPKSPP